jgi:K+-transporting ATPase c subunit
MATNKQNENSRTGNGAEQNGELSNTVKNPDNWTTGDEQMTGAQRSYLTTLSQEAGEGVDEELTKAEASKKIDELQQKTGRGVDH